MGQVHGVYKERPSVLRVVEGTNVDAIQDRIIMLETNLDDVTRRNSRLHA